MTSGQVMPFPQFAAAFKSRPSQRQAALATTPAAEPVPAFGRNAGNSITPGVDATQLRGALIARQPKFGGERTSAYATPVPMPPPSSDDEDRRSHAGGRPSAFMMPSIIEETEDGSRYADDPISWAFNNKNTLYFYTQFDDDSAQDFTSSLTYKKNKILQERVQERGMTPEEARNLTPDDPKFDPDKDIITIDINSPGGVITSLYNMVDTMDQLKSNGIIVKTVAHGLAASCGSLLVALGSPGYRGMTPNSCVMIHQPLGGAQGQATDIQIQNDVIQAMKKKLTRMLYESSNVADFKKGVPDNKKKTYEDFVNAMERDNFLYSKEAIEEFGLIDSIVDT